GLTSGADVDDTRPDRAYQDREADGITEPQTGRPEDEDRTEDDRAEGHVLGDVRLPSAACAPVARIERERPRDEARDHTDRAGRRGGDERAADDDRVDAETLAESARDARDEHVVARAREAEDRERPLGERTNPAGAVGPPGRCRLGRAVRGRG